tara:strand:- start:172 stop:351 length:180 start_codon:yes stop_codon:yes gene_type:complete
MAIGLIKWLKTTFLGYEKKIVRARTAKGQYVADDKSTPDVNEAYKTVEVKKRKARPREK